MEIFMSGETSYVRDIAGITQAKPCVVTTTTDHDYQTNQLVRFSDLGNNLPVPRGMAGINNRRFRITVLDSTSFSIQEVLSGEDVDTTGESAYVSGGSVNMFTRTLALNYPQQHPYSNTAQYISNPYNYEE